MTSAAWTSGDPATPQPGYKPPPYTTDHKVPELDQNDIFFPFHNKKKINTISIKIDKSNWEVENYIENYIIYLCEMEKKYNKNYRILFWFWYCVIGVNVHISPS